MSTSHNHSTSDSAASVSTEKLRDDLRDQLYDAIWHRHNCVIEAPTSSGKTHLASTTEWSSHPEITGGEPVIHFSPTKDARDSAYRKNKESSATGQRLLGRRDACGLAGGEYNGNLSAPDGKPPSRWFTEMCEERGLPFSIAHDVFRRNHDGNLPCSPCKGIQQWKKVPRDEDGIPTADVFFTTHQFARSPELVKDANVILDELPDFSLQLDNEDLRHAICSYLESVDAPVTTYEELMTEFATTDTNRFLLSKFKRPNREWFLKDEHAHALVPGVVKSILSASEGAHNRWVGDCVYPFPDLNPYVETPEHKVRIRVVFEEDYTIKLLQSIPDFSEACCVIGLDAHPTKPKWRANTLPSMPFEQILTPQERQYWRREVRGLEIVQIGDNKYSWTNNGYSSKKVRGVCSELRHRYGEDFRTAATSSQFEDQLRNDMEKAGIEDPETLHYGEEKSVETFHGESCGLVAGCISPSTDSIKDWLALLGCDASPKREEVEECHSGQQWVGEDSEVAHQLLADVREKGVLQTVGRYARSPDDPEDGATVYVMTNVLPESWVDRKVDTVDVLGNKMQAVLSILAHTPDALSASDIADAVDISRKHVHNAVDRLEQGELVTRDVDAGAYNADLFAADRVATCLVDL